MKIDTSVRTKPAPAWFQEGYKNIKVFEEELAQILGISYNFIEKRRIKMMDKPEMKREDIIEAAKDTLNKRKKENYTEEERDRMNILIEIIKSSMNVLWLRFRLENLGEDFEDNDLRYDFTNQTIVIDA